MATAIKAIPTLKGKEAREFLRHAEEAERNYKGTNNRDDHSFCQMLPDGSCHIEQGWYALILDTL